MNEYANRCVVFNACGLYQLVSTSETGSAQGAHTKLSLERGLIDPLWDDWVRGCPPSPVVPVAVVIGAADLHHGWRPPCESVAGLIHRDVVLFGKSEWAFEGPVPFPEFSIFSAERILFGICFHP